MRKHFIFRGIVQGVGFRWTAYHAANSLGVSGFVRNLPDGSVEMEAEGSGEAIDRAVLALQNGRYIQIDSVEVREIPETGERGFRRE